MNPEFIDDMSWEMAEVYGAITDQILINLAHYFRFYKPGEPVPKSSFEYQANMLAQMGQVNKETIRIIRNGLSGADEVLKGTLEQAIIDSVRKAQPELLEAVKKGVLTPASQPAVSPSQMQAFQLYYQQAADKLNLVNTVMLESTQGAYQQCVSDVVAEIGLADSMNRVQIALDTAAGETVTGVSSWNRALRHATDRMKESGVVGFIDHAGRRWTAEAYTAMDIRTTVANTARGAVWETNQNFGNDLYQVSYHNGARPLCYPWQNKIISSLDAARTVVDLDGNEIEVIAQNATSYGQPAGLFGINCKHYPTPFIPGVSIVREGGQDEEANAKSYAESQEQRRLERKLREEKRDILMAKAQEADPEEIKRLQEKARQSSQDIQDFCDSTGRARHRDREAVYTKREFPDKEKYNVADFERKQKETIDKYFSGGGSQQGYTFGQMTPNVSQITPTPTTPTTAPTTIPHTQTANTATAQKTVGDVKDFTEFKKYMKTMYDIDVTAGVKKLDFEMVKEAMSGFESVAKDFPEVTKTIQQIRLSKSGIMSCNGEHITFNSDFFTNRTLMNRTIDRCVKNGWWPKNTNIASIGAHETAHGVEMVLLNLSGKYKTRMQIVTAWNGCYEARDIVKAACDEIMKTPAGKGKTAYEIIKEGISEYGATGGNSETMAEAFADVASNGTNATEIAKAIRRETARKYNDYLRRKP